VLRLVNEGSPLEGKVDVAREDGRLAGLTRPTGQKKAGKAETITDQQAAERQHRARRSPADDVVIGKRGLRHGARRSTRYVTAYDWNRPHTKWRFYTVAPAVGQPLEKNPRGWPRAARMGTPRAIPAFKLAEPPGTVSPTTRIELVYFGTAKRGRAATTYASWGRPDDSSNRIEIIRVHAETGRLAWYTRTHPAIAGILTPRRRDSHQPRIRGCRAPRHNEANKNGKVFYVSIARGQALSGQEFHLHQRGHQVRMKNRPDGTTPGFDWYSRPQKTIRNGRSPYLEIPHVLEARRRRISFTYRCSTFRGLVDMYTTGGDRRENFSTDSLPANGTFPDDTYDAADLNGLLWSPARPQRTSTHE